MSVHPDNLTWSRSDVPIRIDLNGDTDYSMFGDEQLRNERDRQSDQLQELVLHRGGSPAVAQLRRSLEREVERMTDELRRRARSRASLVTEPERSTAGVAAPSIAPVSPLYTEPRDHPSPGPLPPGRHDRCR